MGVVEEEVCGVINTGTFLVKMLSIRVRISLGAVARFAHDAAAQFTRMTTPIGEQPPLVWQAICDILARTPGH